MLEKLYIFSARSIKAKYFFMFFINNQFEWNKKYSHSLADPPESVSIDPLKDEYNVFDRINCTADSRPDIDYYWWTDLSNTTEGPTNEVIAKGEDVSSIEITEKWKHTRWINVIQCTVRNTILGKKYNASVEIKIKVKGKWEILIYI